MKLSAELSNRDHKGGEMMQKKTYCALDIAKFMSAFLVICIHTGPLDVYKRQGRSGGNDGF